MSGNRSRQAWQLSRALTALAGTTVQLEYHGARRDSYGGWHIQWCDGPTPASMRHHVREVAAQYPDIAAAHLEYVRGYSDHSQAVALLLWLDANPHEIAHLSTWSVREAFADVDYPERAAEAWQRRGSALQSLGTPSGMITAEALDTLHWYAGQQWRKALAWLDGLVAGGRRLKAVR